MIHRHDDVARHAAETGLELGRISQIGPRPLARQPRVLLGRHHHLDVRRHAALWTMNSAWNYLRECALC